MIEIHGLSELLRGLTDYQQVRDEEMAIATDYAYEDRLLPALREYGPESPRQTYVRTFNLQGGWDASRMHFEGDGAAGWHARAENPTAYGPYVQGPPEENPHQTKSFEERWNTTKKMLDDNEGEIQAEYEKGLAAVVERLQGRS